MSVIVVMIVVMIVVATVMRYVQAIVTYIRAEAGLDCGVPGHGMRPLAPKVVCQVGWPHELWTPGLSAFGSYPVRAWIYHSHSYMYTYF